MSKYRVKITEHAEKAMREIGLYIIYELRNAKAAFDLLDLFQEQIESLSEMPERIALTKEEPWNGYGIHQILSEKAKVAA